MPYTRDHVRFRVTYHSRLTFIASFFLECLFKFTLSELSRPSSVLGQVTTTVLNEMDFYNYVVFAWYASFAVGTLVV